MLAGKGSRLKIPAAHGTLGAGALTMLTLGSIIGSGLFLASSYTIRLAGPGAVLAYLLGLLITAIELSALAEMAAAEPIPGSFKTYIQRTMGPFPAFLAGYLYWVSGILTMGSELTAAAVFASYFLAAPLWIWDLVFATLLVGVNLVSTKGFSQLESALAAVKVGAIALFILLGSYYLLGGYGYHPSTYLGYGGFFPHGVWGVASAMLLVIFAYAGTAVIGMAAPETRNLRRSLVRTTYWTLGSLLILYVGSILILVAARPWSAYSLNESPFVTFLRQLGLPGVAYLLNFVLLSAVLSALSAALFGVGRMLHALALGGQAPAIFGRRSGNGQPVLAILASGVSLLAVTVASYVIPSHIYLTVTSGTGFISLFLWILILAAHLRYRPLLSALGARPFRLPAFPYLDYLAIALLIAIILTTPFVSGQATGFFVGLGAAALLSLFYLLQNRWPLRRP